MDRRTQLSVILINTPGELAKLCEVLSTSNINILAMNIQNAKDPVKELFKIREKTRRRIAFAESYRGILKDSSDYSIIRILVDNSEEAQKRLTELEYLLDSEPVLVFTLINKPGMLGQVAKRLGKAGININYTYGPLWKMSKSPSSSSMSPRSRRRNNSSLTPDRGTFCPHQLSSSRYHRHDNHLIPISYEAIKIPYPLVDEYD